MAMVVGFTACGDDDKGFSAEQIAYFEKNLEFIREKKVLLLNNTIGERVEAIIPANLGYGYYDYRGIPAGSTLIFTYTIEKFN